METEINKTDGWLRGDTAAGKYLGMSRWTFASLVRGRIKPSIVGGYRYWHKPELDAFMRRAQSEQFTVRADLASRNRAGGLINSSQQ